MGSGISDNYSSIKPIFDAQFWKVHSAIRKSTGESVTLWLLDTKRIKKAMNSKPDYEKYIDSCIESVTKMRKIHHPNILQISDVSENQKEYGFAAEPIEGTLENDKTLNADDVTYIADQLAQTLSFIHARVNLLHLGISPSSIGLTKSMQVKVFAFNFSTPFIGEPVKPIYGKYLENPFHPHICFTSPEYLEGKTLSEASDVFSYATTLLAAYNKKGPVYVATLVDEVVATVSAQAFKMPDDMSEQMQQLLLKATSYEPENRPTIEEIIKSSAFLQLSIRSLRFLDMLATKGTNDKMTFFQGVTQSLPLFSERIQLYHFLPIFVNEVINNLQFGPVLIPVIFNIGSKFELPEFKKNVLNPLKDIINITDPPALGIAILNVVEILMNKLPEEEQNSIIYPIFIGALQSPSHELRVEALKHIPRVIQTMQENSILNSLIPTLLDFISTFDDSDVVCSVIECIGKCSQKVNNDNFVIAIIPKLMLCWVRMPKQPIANSIINLLKEVYPSVSSQMKFVIPMACAIESTPNLPNEIINEINELITSSVLRLKKDRDLEDQANSWHPTESVENDVVAPIKVSQLDDKEIELHRRRSSSHESSTQQQQQQQQQYESSPLAMNDSFVPPPEQQQNNGRKFFRNIFSRKKSDLDESANQNEQPSVNVTSYGPPGPLQTSNYQSQQQSYPSTPSVAPNVGPPGPLPMTNYQIQQQQSYPSTPSVAPRTGPPGPLPMTNYQIQQQHSYPSTPSVAPNLGPPGPLPMTNYQMQQQQPPPPANPSPQVGGGGGPSLFAGLSQGPKITKKTPQNSTAQKLFSGVKKK